jgi:hypothetical protein
MSSRSLTLYVSGDLFHCCESRQVATVESIPMAGYRSKFFGFLAPTNQVEFQTYLFVTILILKVFRRDLYKRPLLKIVPSLTTSISYFQITQSQEVPWGICWTPVTWNGRVAQCFQFGFFQSRFGKQSHNKTSATRSGAHSASYTMGTRGCFPWVKWPRREANHSSPSRTEVKNAWRSISTPTMSSWGGTWF